MSIYPLNWAGPQLIAPQSGVAFKLRRGQILRVTDPMGEQVAGLIAYNDTDRDEWLSSGRTIAYAETIYLSTGHQLYSNRSQVMLEIVADTFGRHDFLLPPCSQESFLLTHGCKEPHPSCFSNLVRALRPFGVAPDAIQTTMNLFMNIDVGPSGKMRPLPPRSRSGDFIELKASMDLVVGLTACAAELANNYRFKPIQFEIMQAPTPAGRGVRPGRGDRPVTQL